MHTLHRRMLLGCSFVLALQFAQGCSDDSQGTQELAPRAVTLYALEPSTPKPQTLIPGVVEPFRQTQIPFEVGGTVIELVEAGDDVVADELDADGAVVAEGTVLARLDPEPLERALRQAELRLEAARRELEANQVQLDSVLPARLEGAQSQAAAAQLNARYAKEDLLAMESAVQLAETTLERNRELLPTGAVSDIAVRQSETELSAQRARLAQARTLVNARGREIDAALSAVAEIEGLVLLQRSNNAAQSAAIEELRESVQDAREDLENCTLRAPFPGRVTELHVGEGSLVQVGSPVVTLTLMNPVETVLTVSASLENQLVVGTDALIYPMDGSRIDRSEAVRATLYRKEGVADTGTRTFEIGLLAPNQRLAQRTSEDSLPTAPYLIPVFENPLDLPGGDGLYTVVEAVAKLENENQGWVLRVKDLAQGARSAETLKGLQTAERVAVRTGERTIQVASFRLVELVGESDLSPGDLLVPEPTPEHAEGFIVADNRWLLRPGDLVQVSLEQGALPEGYYVPVQAIRERNRESRVFVAGQDGRVRSVEVGVFESTGELRRIEAPELEPGQRIVVKGVHFLEDGEAVTEIVEDDAQ